jgi:chromosome segregation ATPase
MERHAVLAAKVESVQKDAQFAEGEKNEAVRKEVLDAKQKVAAQKENLKAAAGDWKKLYDDQMTEFSKQLGKLEKDWNGLDNRRQSLERSILLTQQEISLMMQQIDQINSQANQTNRNNNGIPTGLDLRATFNQQLGQRQAALIQYQFDWNRTVGQQNQMQQQAVGLLNQRQSAVADYQQRTGQLVQHDGQLDKWNKRLNDQATDLEEPPTGKTAQTRSLQQKLKSAAAYLPWDWEAERQRLMKGTEVAKASSGE